jgi:hypothetical protein
MPRNRLLLFVVLLLGVAVVAAAVAPRDRDPFGTSTTDTTPPTSTTRRGPEIATIVRQMPRRDGRPAIVRAREGDLIRLVVNAPEPEQVIIGDNDSIEDAEPGTPARFEFFADEPGTLPVRLESGRLVGRIVIESREAPRRRPSVDDAETSPA